MKRVILSFFLLTTVQTGKFKFRNKFSSLLKLLGETFAENAQNPLNFEPTRNVFRKGKTGKRKRKRWEKKNKSEDLKDLISTMTFSAKDDGKFER